MESELILKQQIEKSLIVLKPRYRKIVEMRIFEDATFKQIALHHGIGIARAREIYIKALRILARNKDLT